MLGKKHKCFLCMVGYAWKNKKKRKGYILQLMSINS